MAKIKIEKRFFELIKSGKKTLEFRKLEKGITKGLYELIDYQTEETLGYAVLRPLAVNPWIDEELIHGGHDVWIPLGATGGYSLGQTDTETFKFVFKNYRRKFIDFICYSIVIVGEVVKDHIEELEEKGGANE